jgi:HSP20 family protein
MVPAASGIVSRGDRSHARENVAGGAIPIGIVIAAKSAETPVGDREKESPHAAKVDFSAGLDGVVDGLGQLLRLAGDLAERPGGGVSGRKLHAVYGISVRFGGLGGPVAERFGNVRQEQQDAPVVGDTHEPMADVIDEDDHYLIIVELPGVDQAAVEWQVEENARVIVRAASRHRNYFKRMTLNERVERDTVSSCYANGVLELKLWKHRRP